MSRTTALGLLLALLVSPFAVASPSWAQDEQTVEIRGPSVVEVGERVALVADNWPSNSVVTFEICGQLAVNGSADCDMATSRSAGVGSDGRTGAQLEVTDPPEPCPCVVRATSTSSTRIATTSLDIQGAPFEPVQADPARLNPASLEVVDAEVRSTFGLGALFGASPQGVAVVSLVNTGQGPLEQVPVTVLYGRGDDDATRMAAEPAVARLGPGEERLAKVPFRLDPLSVGTYTVRMEVGEAARQAVVVREITTYPWGLMVLVLLGLGLVVHRWLRLGRNRARGAGTGPAPEPSRAGSQHRSRAARSGYGSPEPEASG